MATSANIVSDIVTIKVGTGEKQATFQWLGPVLKFHCPFFIGALDHGFKEAEKREIELPEDDPEVFAEFLRWITDHRLADFGPDSDNPNVKTASSYFDLLARVFVFADKYNMPRLQNVVINKFITTFGINDAFPSSAAINYIYDNTAEDSPLRCLVTNFIVISVDDYSLFFKSMSTKSVPYCQAFTQDVLCKVARLFVGEEREIKGRDWWSCVNRCTYHVAEPKPKE